jgi:cytochrome c-type biogenesis protein CcmH/NrfG
VVANPKQVNNEDLLQLAIKAARAGQTDGARVMLRQVVARDRNNETAMLWLAKIAKNRKERVAWLNRVLDQNPDNAAARKALDRMEYKRAATENRMLVLYGAVAVVMVIVTIVVLLVVVL